MLRTKTITWGELSVTVRETKTVDIFEEPNQWAKIAKLTWGKDYDLSDAGALEDWFLLAITRTESVEGFTWPNGDGKAKDYKEAFELFKSLPGGFVRLWTDARRDLEKPPVGDPDLAPPKDLDDDQKKVQE